MVSCPVCGEGLRVDQVTGASVAACASCDGVWLTAGNLDRVTGRPLEADIESWLSEPTECRYCDTPLGFGPTCVRCGKTPTIHCPQGHGVMNATFVEVAKREFEVDRCPSCRGVWIDGHEREHLDATEPPRRRVHAIVPAPPGLDRVGAGGRSIVARGGNTFLSAVNYELSQPSTMILAPGGGVFQRADPHMWGRSQPVALILFALFIGAIVFALYTFVGPLTF